MTLARHFLVWFVHGLERFQDASRGEDMGRPDDGFPLPVGLRHLVGTTHLAEGHAPDDEDHDAWPGAVLPRGLVLVPVTVPGTDSSGAEGGRGTSGDVGVVFGVQLILNRILHDVLDQGSPARELIGLFTHSLLPVQFLPPAEGGI